MTNLRELKPEDRPWQKDEDGDGDEASLRADFEKALREGERVVIIWAFPKGDGEGTIDFSHVHGRRAGCRLSWSEFLSVLHGLVSRFFRDIFH